MLFTLEGREPVLQVDPWKWHHFMETACAFNSQRVTVAEKQIGAAIVSTVFLGVDSGHDFVCGGPFVFHTCILGGPLNGFQRGYPTWADAEAGHAAAVELVQAATMTDPDFTVGP
jgi:hypothetical protein